MMDDATIQGMAEFSAAIAAAVVGFLVQQFYRSRTAKPIVCDIESTMCAWTEEGLRMLADRVQRHVMQTTHFLGGQRIRCSGATRALVRIDPLLNDLLGKLQCWRDSSVPSIRDEHEERCLELKEQIRTECRTA
jgi:hypothetical protein